MGMVTNVVEESIIGHRIIKIFGGKEQEKTHLVAQMNIIAKKPEAYIYSKS